jgi:hypothetical protein
VKKINNKNKNMKRNEFLKSFGGLIGLVIIAPHAIISNIINENKPERIRIYSSGRLGIKTMNPTTKLIVDENNWKIGGDTSDPRTILKVQGNVNPTTKLFNYV